MNGKSDDICVTLINCDKLYQTSSGTDSHLSFIGQTTERGMENVIFINFNGREFKLGGNDHYW